MLVVDEQCVVPATVSGEGTRPQKRAHVSTPEHPNIKPTYTQSKETKERNLYCVEYSRNIPKINVIFG